MTKISEYPEYCRCKNPSNSKCGCGINHLRYQDGAVIHYDGSHWNVMCALVDAHNTVLMLREALVIELFEK